jgi:exopolysaccharide production protein ExoQ
MSSTPGGHLEPLRATGASADGLLADIAVSEGRSPRMARLARQRRILRRIAMTVEFLLVLLLFVPIATLPAAAGQADFFRIAIMALLTTMVPALAVMPERTLRLVGRTWPVLALLSWFFITAAWAPYADLTIRRATGYFAIYLLAISISASLDEPADFHWPLFWALLAILFLNVASAGGLSSARGAALSGIYSQKNGAGTVTLYVVLVASSSILVARRLWIRALALAVLPASWAFLISTHAKTAIGTGVLLSAALPAVGFILAQRQLYKLLAGISSLLVATVALFGFTFLDLDAADVASALLGDLTLTQRTSIWSALLPEIAVRPWTGYGFGSFWATGRPLNPIAVAPRDAWFLQADLINEAHDGFLDIALQAGVVGLALCLLAAIRCIASLSGAVAAPGLDRRDRIVCATLLGLGMAMLLGNVTESLVFQPSNPVGYFFLLLIVQAERWRLPPSGSRVPAR